MNKKPLSVYLDYNVFVSLQDGDLTIDGIKKLVGTTNVVFPFSASHIEEIKNIKAHNGIPHDTVIKERLHFFDSVTKKQYLERISFDIPYKKRSVSSLAIYDTLNDVPWVQVYYKVFSDSITEEQKLAYREHLGLDSKTLNNIKPQEIVEHLNGKFLYQHHNMSFLEMLNHAKTFHPSTYKWGIETDVVSLFALLDVIGYWKDKCSENSNVARFWDSSHCGFATFCDVLVSQDERMRLKSEVAYNVFNIKTKILSPK